MGAFQSVPDDVLTGMMAECVVGIPYHKPNYKEKMLVLRTTCKDGRDLVRRILADKNRFPSMSLFFSSEQANSATVATEPREMRVSAQHVEAVGRVLAPGARISTPAVAPRKELPRSRSLFPERPDWTILN